MDAIIDVVKYVVGIVLSGVLSAFAWMFRKVTDRLDLVERYYYDVSSNQKVLETKIESITEDIAEIKSDLKKILYKL